MYTALGFAALSPIYIGVAMSVFGLNEIRGGMKLIIDNDPCVVVDNVFVKPGKGQAFNRLRYRNLKTAV